MATLEATIFLGSGSGQVMLGEAAFCEQALRGSFAPKPATMATLGATILFGLGLAGIGREGHQHDPERGPCWEAGVGHDCLE